MFFRLNKNVIDEGKLNDGNKVAMRKLVDRFVDLIYEIISYILIILKTQNLANPRFCKVLMPFDD